MSYLALVRQSYEHLKDAPIGVPLQGKMLDAAHQLRDVRVTAQALMELDDRVQALERANAERGPDLLRPIG